MTHPSPVLGAPGGDLHLITTYEQILLMVKANRDDMIRFEVALGKVEYLLRDNEIMHTSNDYLRKRVEALELEKEKTIYNQGVKNERAKAKRATERRKKSVISKLERKRAGGASKKGKHKPRGSHSHKA